MEYFFDSTSYGDWKFSNKAPIGYPHLINLSRYNSWNDKNNVHLHIADGVFTFFYIYKKKTILPLLDVYGKDFYMLLSIPDENPTENMEISRKSNVVTVCNLLILEKKRSRL